MNLQQLKDRQTPIRAFFVDDGGVLNDNRLRGLEYRRLIGGFMSTRLGGTPQQWLEANSAVFPPLWAEIQSRITDFPSHQAYQREYELQWINRQCAIVGVSKPDENTAVNIAREAAVYIGKYAKAEIAGVAESIWALHRAGYSIYSASGTPSWELKEIYTRMGIFEAFSALYGPDIIDSVKHGTEFYSRIFAHAGVKPNECIVIESSQKCCDWAITTGAEAIWVDCEQADSVTLQEIVAALL